MRDPAELVINEGNRGAAGRVVAGMPSSSNWVTISTVDDEGPRTPAEFLGSKISLPNDQCQHLPAPAIQRESRGACHGARAPGILLAPFSREFRLSNDGDKRLPNSQVCSRPNIFSEVAVRGGKTSFSFWQTVRAEPHFGGEMTVERRGRDLVGGGGSGGLDTCSLRTRSWLPRRQSFVFDSSNLARQRTHQRYPGEHHIKLADAAGGHVAFHPLFVDRAPIGQITPTGCLHQKRQAWTRTTNYGTAVTLGVVSSATSIQSTTSSSICRRFPAAGHMPAPTSGRPTSRRCGDHGGSFRREAVERHVDGEER